MSDMKFYTTRQVAERYGVKETTVLAWIRTGKIGANKLGDRIYRISESDLDQFEQAGRNK